LIEVVGAWLQPLDIDVNGMRELRHRQRDSRRDDLLHTVVGRDAPAHVIRDRIE
jgi:hypothetical protein